MWYCPVPARHTICNGIAVRVIVLSSTVLVANYHTLVGYITDNIYICIPNMFGLFAEHFHLHLTHLKQRSLRFCNLDLVITTNDRYHWKLWLLQECKWLAMRTRCTNHLFEVFGFRRIQDSLVHQKESEERNIFFGRFSGILVFYSRLTCKSRRQMSKRFCRCARLYCWLRL